MHNPALERLNAALIPSDVPNADSTNEERTAFITDTLDKANWVSLKLQQYKQKTAEIEAWRAARIERINEIVDTELKRIEPSIGYFENQLTLYLNQELQSGRKTKTLDLEGGTFRMRDRQPTLTLGDNLIPWAQENAPDLLKTTISVDRTKLRKSMILAEDGAILTKDGEIIPATWEEQPPTSTFTPAGT